MNNIRLENYFFGSTEQTHRNKRLVLVIYDITDNKRRGKFVRFLEKYGVRVQKSAFEMIIDSSKYNKLISEIPGCIEPEDNIRIYRIPVAGEVLAFGSENIEKEEVIII